MALSKIIEVVGASDIPNRESYCEILRKLAQVFPEGIQLYFEKLQNNHQNRDVLNDLLFEGRTALMFLNHGFQIKFRESPDLRLKFMGTELYAEVKHFRLKEQDRLDQETLANFDQTLTTYGDTVPTECIPAWEQVFCVINRKLRQFSSDAPNLCAIGSDSPHCIDDAIIPTVINMINKTASTCTGEEFRKLNGIILIAFEFNLSKKRRVYFFPTQHSFFPLTEKLASILDSIRNG